MTRTLLLVKDECSWWAFEKKKALGYAWYSAAFFRPSKDEVRVLAAFATLLRLAHEIGHAKGLGHTFIPFTIMFPVALRGWNGRGGTYLEAEALLRAGSLVLDDSASHYTPSLSP